MLCISLIHAQVRFGVKGGLNFENFRLKDAKELSIANSAGWQLGGLLQFKVPIVNIGVQPELLYTVKNAKVEEKEEKETNSIHYFELPLNVRWSLNFAVVRPFLTGGPYLNYAVKTEGGIFETQINKLDWGIGLGGGVEMWNLQLGARYSWGMQNISKAADFEIKNNTFTVSLAYLF